MLKKILVYRDVWLSFLSCWIVLVTLSLAGIILGMGRELGLGLLLGILFLPLLIKSHGYFVRQVKVEGRQFFKSKFGYIVFGICVGLVAISTIFNLTYEPGWFNFTDLGFYFLSFPLILITHFEPESYDMGKRLVLYLIVFVNLVGVIYILDIVGFLISKIYKKIKLAS